MIVRGGCWACVCVFGSSHLKHRGGNAVFYADDICPRLPFLLGFPPESLYLWTAPQLPAVSPKLPQRAAAGPAPTPHTCTLTSNGIGPVYDTYWRWSTYIHPPPHITWHIYLSSIYNHWPQYNSYVWSSASSLTMTFICPPLSVCPHAFSLSLPNTFSFSKLFALTQISQSPQLSELLADARPRGVSPGSPHRPPAETKSQRTLYTHHKQSTNCLLVAVVYFICLIFVCVTVPHCMNAAILHRSNHVAMVSCIYMHAIFICPCCVLATWHRGFF